MNICIITPRGNASGGAEKSLLGLVDFLQRRSHKIYVITFQQSGTLFTELKKRDVEIYSVATEFWIRMSWEDPARDNEKMASIFRSATEIAFKLRDWGIDVLYTNTSVTNVGAVAATVLGIPHIWHIRESVTEHSEYTPVVDFPVFAKYVDANSSHVIFISEYLKQQYQKFTPLKHVSVIYNLVKFDRFDFGPVYAKHKVDIVIPFYNDRNIFNCIESINTHWCDEINNVTIIDDQGPDRELAKEVEDWVNQHSDKFKYEQNEQNLGFVLTCNRGMSESENDVLLLNTDTIVTSNWVTKLSQIAYQSEKISTVTPLSNSASYYSIPDPHHKEFDGKPEESNRILEMVTPTFYINTHTGHGFCLYIKRDVINTIGKFNEELFGKGYGEEVDLCMRALRAGYQNVVATNTYIYHLEGQSFKLENKKAVVNERSKIIRKLYPEITQLEKDFHTRNELEDIKKLFVYFKQHPELIDAKKLCIVGTVEPNKNQQDAIAALAELVSSGRKELHLLIVGEIGNEEYKTRLDKLAADLGITNHVHYLGFIRNPFSVYQMSAASLICSKSEGFGRTAVESMLVGTPVISTLSGGLAEIVTDKDTGLVYQPGDIQQLSKLIAQALDNPKETANMIMRATNFANEKFGEGNTAGYEPISNILDEIFQQLPPKRPKKHILLTKEFYTNLLDPYIIRYYIKNLIIKIRSLLKYIPFLHIPWVMYHNYMGKRHPERYK